MTATLAVAIPGASPQGSNQPDSDGPESIDDAIRRQESLSALSTGTLAELDLLKTEDRQLMDIFTELETAVAETAGAVNDRQNDLSAAQTRATQATSMADLFAGDIEHLQALAKQQAVEAYISSSLDRSVEALVDPESLNDALVSVTMIDVVRVEMADTVAQLRKVETRQRENATIERVAQAEAEAAKVLLRTELERLNTQQLELHAVRTEVNRRITILEDEAEELRQTDQDLTDFIRSEQARLDAERAAIAQAQADAEAAESAAAEQLANEQLAAELEAERAAAERAAAQQRLIDEAASAAAASSSSGRVDPDEAEQGTEDPDPAQIDETATEEAATEDAATEEAATEEVAAEEDPAVTVEGIDPADLNSRVPDEPTEDDSNPVDPDDAPPTDLLVIPAGPPTADSALMIWPLPGVVVSGFGNRVHPIFGTVRHHAGLDIDGDMGEAMTSSLAGTVLSAGWQGGYGNTVVIDHGDGIATLYAHMSDFAVQVGQVVNQGEVIGYVGSTGNSTGPHLHFEVRVEGIAVDPLNYLPLR